MNIYDILPDSTTSIKLIQEPIMLNEVVVRAKEIDIVKIIKQARRSYKDNYFFQLNDIGGFYREIIKMDGMYAGFTEAIININDIDGFINKKIGILVNPELEILEARRSDYKNELCFRQGPLRHILLPYLVIHWRFIFDDLFRNREILNGKFRLLNLDTYEGNEVYVIEYTSKRPGYLKLNDGMTEVKHLLYIEAINKGILKIETDIRNPDNSLNQYSGIIKYASYKNMWYPNYINFSYSYPETRVDLAGKSQLINDFAEVYLSKMAEDISPSKQTTMSDTNKNYSEPIFYKFYHLPDYNATFWNEQAYQPNADYKQLKIELSKNSSLAEQFSDNSGKWIINKEHCLEVLDFYKTHFNPENLTQTLRKYDLD